MKKPIFTHLAWQMIAGALLVVFVFGQSGQQEPALKLQTEIVNLTVTVTDRRNVAVPGLEPHHFKVYEDNVQQQIEYFRCEDEPLSIGIIFDLSGSMKKKLLPARAAVHTFLQASNQEDDSFLLGFNQRCNLIADFAEADLIEARLEASQAEGKTALYDAVDMGSEKVLSGRHAKRVLLVISDGGDNASRFSQDDLYQRLREEGILIYCLGYGIWWSDDFDDERRFLEDLAKITGGRAFFPDSAAELEAAVSTIALELRRQYSLAYTARATGQDKQWRKIKVRVSPPTAGLKLRVRTREGYYPLLGAEP